MSEEIYIWFNPEMNEYQTGPREEFDFLVSKSANNSFLLLHKFDELSVRLANRITAELNTAQLEYELTH